MRAPPEAALVARQVRYLSTGLSRASGMRHGHVLFVDVSSDILNMIR
jgi:hypothetical protein